MIYNTHLVVLQGTGRDMVPVKKMQSLGERYHFEFKADEKGLPSISFIGRGRSVGRKEAWR